MNQSLLHLHQSPSIKLKWTNCSLIQKHTQKNILNNLSGEVQSSDFLTIMGSSGAGKSSFLSLITKTFQHYENKFTMKGRITINQKQYSQSNFFSIASFVPQDDLLLETLTVEQTLSFQAALKLHKMKKQQRIKEVEKVLKLLNLYEIRNSYVGGKQKKSISGGQKKRVAIGVQLISNPSCLILDQPTSGLDSYNSLKIIKLLSQLAHQLKKLIIATIHQPSTLSFQNFDKLMLLNKGQQIYFQKAQEIIPYMENLQINIDYRMNPADFFMLQISSHKQSANYKTPMTYQNFQHYKQKINKKQRNYQLDQNTECSDTKISIFQIQQNVPYTYQIKPLFSRNIKNFIRSPSNQGGRLMQLICFPLFVGVLFYDILDKLPPLDQTIQLQIFLRQFVSFIFLGLLFTISQSVYDTILTFPSQKQLVMKQVHSNMYSLPIYYITKLTIEVPIMLLSIVISNSIVYSIIGLKNDFYHWFIYLLIVSIIGVCGYLLGIIVGALCKTQQYAVQAIPFIMMPMIAFGGQVVNLESIPWFSKWVQYCTPVRYAFNIITKTQLQTDQLYNMGDDTQVQQLLGLSGTTKQNTIQLGILAYGFLVLSFAVLYFRKKFG